MSRKLKGRERVTSKGTSKRSGGEKARGVTEREQLEQRIRENESRLEEGKDVKGEPLTPQQVEQLPGGLLTLNSRIRQPF